MVRLRLKRMGNRHRPFYRIVAAKSTASRDGAFIEAFGNYNPLTNPKQIEIDADRAFHWLMVGAQPSETVAYLFKKEGILDKYFAERPKAKEKYKFLDKTTATMSQQSVVGPAGGETDSAAETAQAPMEEPVAEAAPEKAEGAPVEAEQAPEVEAVEEKAEAKAEESAESAPEEPAGEDSAESEKSE